MPPFFFSRRATEINDRQSINLAKGLQIGKTEQLLAFKPFYQGCLMHFSAFEQWLVYSIRFTSPLPEILCLMAGSPL